MQIYSIKIENQSVDSHTISVTLLQALLSVLIEGSKGALRLRTEGRSMVRGAPPQWIKSATTFSMAFKDKQLQIGSPTLYESVPELFHENEKMEELQPESTAIDYFQESLAAVLNNELEDSLYDKALLELLQGFRHTFHQGADSINFFEEGGPEITLETIKHFKDLADSIPPSRRVKMAGRLEQVRSNDRTFKLITTPNNIIVKGITQPMTQKEVQALLGKEVLISGIAFYTASGKTLRIETDQISLANAREEYERVIREL
ncbi:hypothetical protein QUF74_10480 [Candidatus Halobeggiatoa sp. HSG11]|nr:hypothetical protein [Candidatus Halobeggiatoa sp. HSG11]